MVPREWCVPGRAGNARRRVTALTGTNRFGGRAGTQHPRDDAGVDAARSWRRSRSTGALRGEAPATRERRSASSGSWPGAVSKRRPRRTTRGDRPEQLVRSPAASRCRDRGSRGPPARHRTRAMPRFRSRERSRSHYRIGRREPGVCAPGDRPISPHVSGTRLRRGHHFERARLAPTVVEDAGEAL
jgi:hypothetical protein